MIFHRDRFVRFQEVPLETLMIPFTMINSPRAIIPIMDATSKISKGTFLGF